MVNNNKTGKKVISLIVLFLIIILLNIFVFIKTGNNDKYQKVIKKVIELDEVEMENAQISKVSLGANAFDSIEDVVWPKLEENGNIKDDYAIVSESKITNIIDGTAPWDSDNNAGNDSANNNGIVRSFDTVTYNLEISLTANTIEHPELVGEQLKGGYVFITATLEDGDYYWDIDSMSWATSFWGQVSTDKKTIVAIIKRDSATELNSAKIKDLPLCVKVLGAQNESEIPLPEVKVWMNGNKEEDIKITGTDIENNGKIIVSAAQKYNVYLHSTGTDLGKRVYLNFNTGKSTTSEDENAKLGRIYGMSVEVDLQNTLTYDGKKKGMKGIEMPVGEISVDLDCYVTKDETKVDIKPVLWNYSINWESTGEIKDRQFSFGSINTLRDRYVPAGKISYTNSELNAAYDSGNVKMTQEEAGKNIKISFSNYKTNGIFPTKINSYYDERIANVGCIAVGYLQLFVPEPTEEGIYYVNVSDGGGKENPIESADVTKLSINNNEIEQQTYTDDFFKCSYYMKTYGNYSHYINLLRTNNKNLASEFGGSDAKVINNQIFYGNFYIGQNTANDDEAALREVNKLIKFDAEGFELLDYSETEKFYSTPNTMTWNMWYVTKKDGTNWISDDELRDTNIEDLKVFQNKEDIPKTSLCVGVYFESKDGILQTPTNSSMQYIKLKFKVRDNAKIGKVYVVSQDDFFWRSDFDRNIYTVANYIEENHTISESAVLYPKDVTITATFKNEKYIKSQYDEYGSLIMTHNQWTYGQSVLIVGAKTLLEKTVTDLTIENNPKTLYNLSNNEYEVTYKLSPTITQDTSVNADIITGVTVTVEDVLPKGLTYIEGSSSIGEPNISINEETGETTLVWDIKNCTANVKIEPIIYKAHIDEESAIGTEYVTKAKAICKEYYSNSNIIPYSVQTVIIGGERIYKIVNNPVINTNEIVHYKVVFANNTSNTQTNFKVLDILPYNGDNKGTSFNGSYTLDHLEVSGGNNVEIYVTNNEDVRTNSSIGYNIDEDKIWTKVSNLSNIKDNEKAFLVTGNLNENSQIAIDVYLQTNGNKSGDIYVNNAKELISNLKSTNVKASVVNRSLGGKIWLDENKNGLMDETEKLLNEIEIILLDDKDNIVSTTKTASDGSYKFDNLKKGKYKVKVNTNNYYFATTKGVGEDTLINSKINNEKETDIISELDINSTVKVENVNAGLFIEKINIPVTKIWNDNDNLNNKRPENITVKLMNGTTQVGMQILNDLNKKLENSNQWYYVFTNVEKYDKDGNLINYTIEEQWNNVLYKKTIIGDNTGYTIENTFEVPNEKINLTVNKEWNDQNNKNSKRPDSVIIQIMNGATVVTEKEINTTNKAEGNDNLWVYTFTDLPKYNDKGDIIGYTVAEKEKTEGDLEFYSITETTGSIESGYTIKNTFKVPNEKISLEVIKKWNDNEDQYKKRPASIYLIVKNGEKVVQKQLVKADENWKCIFTQLAKYDEENGNIVNYTVDEEEVNSGDLMFYEKSINNNEITNTFKVTNETLINSITKVANKEEIKKDGDEIEYNINYTASINNYIGTATATIEDVLPYNIDSSKSNLNGGTYNEETKTIKWMENIEGINTFNENKTKEINIQKTVKLVYVNYPTNQENLEIENKATGKIVLNTTGKASEKVEAISKVKVNLDAGKVIVNHYLEGTEEKLATSEEKTGEIGLNYETSANEEVLKNYELVTEPSNKNGKFSLNDQIVNYYYRKRKGNLIVEYKEKGTEKDLIDSLTSTEYVGTEYKTQEKTIPYYKLVEVVGDVEGKYNAETKKVIYYYEKLQFNLAVYKKLTSYTINGISTVNITDLGKVEIDKKEINQTDINLVYKIIVKNTGEIAGSTDVIENIPEGFSVEANLNKVWEIDGQQVKLSTEILNPGESKEYEITLTWNKDSNAFGTVKNVIKISNMKNDAGFDDAIKEDNEDYAEFILAIKTGIDTNEGLLILGIALELISISTIIAVKKFM